MQLKRCQDLWWLRNKEIEYSAQACNKIISSSFLLPHSWNAISHFNGWRNLHTFCLCEKFAIYKIQQSESAKSSEREAWKVIFQWGRRRWCDNISKRIHYNSNLLKFAFIFFIMMLRETTAVVAVVGRRNETIYIQFWKARYMYSREHLESKENRANVYCIGPHPRTLARFSSRIYLYEICV